MGMKSFGGWDMGGRCRVGTVQLLVCGCEVVWLSRGACVALHLCVVLCLLGTCVFTCISSSFGLFLSPNEISTDASVVIHGKLI